MVKKRSIIGLFLLFSQGNIFSSATTPPPTPISQDDLYQKIEAERFVRHATEKANPLGNDERDRQSSSVTLTPRRRSDSFCHRGCQHTFGQSYVELTDDDVDNDKENRQ